MTGLAFSNAAQGNQGEMRDARRVGMYPAKSPTVVSKKIAPTKVAGYVGVVPNSSEAIPFATTKFRGNTSQRQPQSPASSQTVPALPQHRGPQEYHSLEFAL
jgi:hypothetical protein